LGTTIGAMWVAALIRVKLVPSLWMNHRLFVT
jgi:hypothetical protein